MTIGILYGDEVKGYDFGAGHPFRGDRFEVFLPFLKHHLVEGRDFRLLDADPATEDDLLLICHREYIEFSETFYRAAHSGTASPGKFSGTFFRFHSIDNVPSRESGPIEEAARKIVGQGRAACDLVQGGAFSKIVSLGGGLHHAKPSYGEGFCVYNDVAFCGRYLMKAYGLERIVILDTDAHAGNGTCAYFYDDPRILFIDLHQDPSTIYPRTGYPRDIGTGEGTGYTVNIPMPVGAGDESYARVFDSVVEPLVQEFRPQILIRNGGSDPHFADRLTQLGLSTAGFRMIGDRVRKMAETCGGKVIDLLTSGYNLEVLPDAWLSLIAGLASLGLKVEEPWPGAPRTRMDPGLEGTLETVGEVKRYLRPYWKCMED